MKTIVALVDFSDVTPKVLNQAETLAKAFDSQVIIMHAVRTETVDLSEYGPDSVTLLEAHDQAMRAGQAKLLELQDSLTKSGVNVSSQELPDAVLGTILDECGRLNADLIIVGSNHHSTLYNLFIGTFTHDLLERASCPLLVVPAEPGAK